MPFGERDVSRDPAAARELIRKSGQRGVPVIEGDGEIIVGFDRPRLERLVQRVQSGLAGRGIRLGIQVKSVPGGVEVGSVRAGSVGERAGIRLRDVIVSIGGRPVGSATELEAVLSGWSRGRPLALDVARDGVRLHLVAQP